MNILTIEAQPFIRPIKITAELGKEDSTLSIFYQNLAPATLALWVGDFNINYLGFGNKNTFSAKLVRQDIYVASKKNFGQDASYFGNNHFYEDTMSECSLGNYKLLAKGEKLSLRFKLSSQLLNLCLQNQACIYNYCSFLNIQPLLSYAASKKLIPFRLSELGLKETQRLFYPDSVILMNKIKWSEDFKSVGKNTAKKSIDGALYEDGSPFRAVPTVDSLYKPFKKQILNFNIYYSILSNFVFGTGELIEINK